MSNLESLSNDQLRTMIEALDGAHGDCGDEQSILMFRVRELSQKIAAEVGLATRVKSGRRG